MKFFAILILCASALFGETISAKYEISFGVFGAVGSANTRLVRQGDRYEIVMDAVAQGVAGSLSGQRRESFRSKGRVVAGLLMPDLYVHEVSRKKGKTTKNERKTYAFDYARKTIKFQKFKGTGDDLQLVSDEILPRAQKAPTEGSTSKYRAEAPLQISRASLASRRLAMRIQTPAQRQARNLASMARISRLRRFTWFSSTSRYFRAAEASCT